MMAKKANTLKGKTRMTKHFQEDRINRAVYIGLYVGYGDIVHKRLVKDEHGVRMHCVTNTGVDIIKDPAEKAVVTAYVLTPTQLKRLFNSEGEIPLSLMATVKSNTRQEHHIKSEQYKAE
jgi:hypothetical protein